MRKIFALAVLCAGSALAQSDVWIFSRTAALSSASVAFTIALPPTGANQVQLLDYTLQCTADCSVTTERNGSAPTATQGTWRPEDWDTAPKSDPTTIIQPSMRVYYNSDSTGGVLQDEPFVFPAGAIVPWSTGVVILTGSGLTNNWTLRIGPMTGTYRIQIKVRARR